MLGQGTGRLARVGDRRGSENPAQKTREASMQWAVGRILAVPLWLFALVVAAYMFVLRIAEYIGRPPGRHQQRRLGGGIRPNCRCRSAFTSMGFALRARSGMVPTSSESEIGRISKEAHKVAADIATFSAEQSRDQSAGS